MHLPHPHHLVQQVQLLLVMMIAGCTVGPDYQPPQVNVAGSYFSVPPAGRPASGPASRPSTVVEGSMRVTQWWALFNDPTLNWLIDQATQSNLDLKLAQARVREG